MPARRFEFRRRPPRGGSRFPAVARARMQRRFRTTAVTLVYERVDERHGTGKRHFEAVRRSFAREARVVRMHGAQMADRADDRRTIGFVSVAANAPASDFARVDAVLGGSQSGARNDAGTARRPSRRRCRALLFEERDARCVVLRLAKRVARRAPGRPQGLGLRKPRGLRQTAGNRRRKPIVRRFDKVRPPGCW